MGDLIAWLIIGLVAGLLANLIVRGESTGGCIGSIVIGLLGAIVGGFIFDALGLRREFTWLGSILVATVGAVIILWVLRVVQGD